jgi:CubicO group peptidase (beta-lactamase class C family)
LFYLIFSGSLFSQTSIKQSVLIDSVVKSFYNNRLFHGFVLVAQNDSILFQKGYGYADIEKKFSFSTDTKIKIGSVSKQFTAFLILRLVDQGKIDLNKTIADYLDYAILKKYSEVTIQQLLIMSSGIPDYDIPQETLKEYHDALYYLNYLNNKPFIYEPGTSYNYSNPNYDILGLIVERITGMTLEETYKKMIFDKIGMVNSGLDFIPDTITNKAKSYKISPTGYEPAYEENLYLVRGCGSIYSTPSDLLKWDNSLLKNEILSESLYDNYFKPYTKMDSNTYYSYGWIIEYYILKKNDTIKIARHEGSAPVYFNCINYIDLSNNYIIIIIDNTVYSYRREILAQIRNILYNKPVQFAKKSLYFETADMIKQKGIEFTINHLLSIDPENNNYQWGRYDLDYLKGYYKRQDKIKEYLELHRACMYLYPEFKEFSSWAINNFKKLIKSDPVDGKLYFYLGAYQLFDGNKVKAQRNLEKSLSLGIENEYEEYIKQLINECKD